jgi:hypothetical protein
MTLDERIHVLSEVGLLLQSGVHPKMEAIIHQAHINNQWFTIDNINKSIRAICSEYLEKEKLSQWVQGYELAQINPKTVAIVMAGNIPMVGFHDMLCSFISGHKTMLKCSSKDEVLIPAIIEFMAEIDPRVFSYFEKVEQLKGFDAVIATGGDTAAVHFEYYFSKYPHIIRKNRSSIAILDGTESPEELASMAEDVFDYFGLGCRSLSKVYLPTDFHTDRLFEAFYPYKEIINHNKYKNNFDYNHAIYVLTLEPFLTNDVVILKEDSSIASRISCLHYERYQDINRLNETLKGQKDSLQCVSSKNPIEGWQHIPLGKCQKPDLADYADYVDTMDFLIKL